MKSARHTHAAENTGGVMNEQRLREIVRTQLDQMYREGFAEEDAKATRLGERLLARKPGRAAGPTT